VKMLLIGVPDMDNGIEYVMLDIKKQVNSKIRLALRIVIPVVIIGLLTAACVLLVLYYRKGRYLRRLVRDPSRGVLLLNRKGEVYMLNTMMGNIFGLGKEVKLKGSFCRLRLPAASMGIQKTICNGIEKGGYLTSQINVIEGDKERWFEISVWRIQSFGWAVSCVDVTEREFGRKVSTLIPIAQQLAHGIKNPLSHIRMAVQRLKKLLLQDKGKKEETIYCSDVVAEEIERLSKLTDGFSRFIKLEPPRLSAGNIIVPVSEVINRFRRSAPEGVKFSITCPSDLPEVMIDQAQISIVFDHLLDNAVAAVGENGKVSVAIKKTEIKDSRDRLVPGIEVRISDTGPGIPTEYLSKVFNPYFSLKQGGSGLGLAIVRKIVEDHGGVITVESEEGKGAAFIIALLLEGMEDEG
ncbi:GHKL domain-containing protein, partial [candidate division WOR-3 bacterium]|nr:GHKL domain-containing protein [candidate division WOR-3 bacterium]MBD3364548.1 GHKL domain-containing protein [candidate division WOR-3 bacterium]